MRVVTVVVVAATLVYAPFASSLGTGTGGAVLSAQETGENPNAPTEESIAGGRRVYARFCASCHGTTGEGDGAGAFGDVPPANLVDDEWTYGGATDAEVFKTIAEGVPPDYYMEEWAGRVSDDDIWNIINYLRDLAAQ